MEQFHVRWQVSSHDLRHGLPRDVVPHVVAGAVGIAWFVAPLRGGVADFRWLGLALVAVQALFLARALVRHAIHLRAADRVLTVQPRAYVVTDTRGVTVYDEAVVGVVDDHGVLRLEFADGDVLEAPWRAFTHADLRALRQHLRAHLDAAVAPHHVPVRVAGRVTGTGAWRRPVLALAVAGVAAALPWLVDLPA